MVATDARGPGPEPSSLVTDRDDIDLWTIVEVMRRRWKLLLLAVVVAVGAGAAWVVSRPATYTTGALVQKQVQSSPLSGLALEVWEQPSDMLSEVEILRSRAILGPATETLRLSLRLPGNQYLREALLASALVSSEVPPGEFLIRGDGSRLQLIDAETGAARSTGALGDTLVGPGFAIPIRSVPRLTEDVRLAVYALPDAIDALSAGLTVEPVEWTNLIRLRYTARDPTFAAEVLNAVVNSYIDHATFRARDVAGRRREFLAEQLASVADSVRAAQAQLARFQEQERVLDPAAQSQSLAQNLRADELRVRQLRYQEGLLQSLVVTLTSEGSGEGLERIMTLSEEIVPGAVPVYTRLRGFETERQRLTVDRFGFRAGSSRVAVVDSLIQSARRELRVLVTESLDLTGTRLREAEQEAATLRQQVERLPAQATAISTLEQNAWGVISTFDLITERYYEAQVAEATATADVDVVDYATPPLWPDDKSTALPLMVALFLGLGGGAFAVVLLESLDTTVHRSGDAEAATGLSVLGMVPELSRSELPRAKTPPLVVRAQHNGAPSAEAFRALPSMIRFARPEALTVLAVVSQGPQEGKSFIAGNLALAMAAAGKRVLLIDCDFRRPRLDAMFNIKRSPGLSDVLTHQANLDSIAHEVSGCSLWVLPAGSRVPDPATLLSSDHFRDVIERAKTRFDVVILDTPPVLAASEVLEISAIADGVILVAKTEKTNRLALAEAASRLRRVDATLLGLLLNGVQSGPRQGYYYGGYYYRTYSYGDYGDEEGQERKKKKKKKRA